jgi:hypothetical protein
VLCNYDLMRKLIISIPVCTAILIVLFLSGHIIQIEKGTHDGGITGAIGVGVILPVMFLISFLIATIRKKRQKHLRDVFPGK